MHGIEHPINGDLYEPAGEGRVLITRTDGSSGVYAGDGRWLEGAKFDADLHLCGWISGPRGVHRMVN